MASNSRVTVNMMAGRILDREDNKYKKEVILDIINMYMEECQKAIINGDRVQLSGIGTIIPRVKTHIGSYNMPICNVTEGNPPPYVKVELSRNYGFARLLKKTLLDNIKEGIYGLRNLPFEKQQIRILKDSGFIPADIKESEE